MKHHLELELNRKLRCDEYRILMTVSKFEKQDEILAVLTLFKEHGSLGKEVVNTELLDQPPDSSYGFNVLQVVETYRLISSHNGRYEITETGKESLSKGSIPFPSRSVCNVTVSDDPLLPTEILDIQQREEIGINRKSGSDTNLTDNLKKLPDNIIRILEKWKDKSLNLPAQSMQTVLIQEFEENEIKIDCKSSYSLSLRVRYREKPALFFKDNQANKSLAIKTPENLDSSEIISHIMEGYGYINDLNDDLILLVRVKDLTPLEITSFKKSFTIEKPTIPDYGSFEKIRIEGMGIFPSTLSEAKKWAEKLLVHSINRYIDREQFKELAIEICKKFEALYSPDDIREDLPDYDDLVNRAKSGDKELKDAYWYLIAPADLSAEGDFYE